MRLSMTPQRLDKSQISLSLGLVSGYGIAVAPYGGWTLVSVSSRPHALIAGRLRTHRIQSPEAGSSTLVGRRCRSSSRHNCLIGVFVRPPPYNVIIHWM